MKHVIVGTAGHIDHGKSSLVLKLTGTDPDRWVEEKRRGITIDLGFAHLETGDFRFGFVDVPGHERFVRNMLAGAGGVDLVILVIAADESIMPQTREHFDICRLLGVGRGLVALTKTDLVDSDVIGLVRLETEDFLRGSFLEGAPIVPFSGKTGEGADELKSALVEVAAGVAGKDSTGHLRLPVDRSFVMKGFGTVVTGTLVAGSIAVEDEVEVFPEQRRLRVRGLQVHGEKAERAVAGQRTAVNLAGVNPGELQRGMVLARPGRFRNSVRLDVLLQLLPSSRPLKDGARVHFHQGTAETIAVVKLLGQAIAEPGRDCFAQLRLAAPVLVLPGDRFILRQYSPVITIGGGRVLGLAGGRFRRRDPETLRYFENLRDGSREQILATLLQSESHGVLTAPDLVARLGWRDGEIGSAAAALVDSGEALQISGSPLTIVRKESFATLGRRVVEQLDEFHRVQPLVEGLPREELREKIFGNAPPQLCDAVLAELAAAGEVVSAGERVKRAGQEVTLSREETEAREAIEHAFREAGLQVPAVKEVLAKLKVDAARARQIVQLLLKENVLVRVTADLHFHRDALERLESLLREYKERQGEKMDVAAFKDLAGVTRKYAIPLLEYLDRRRVTQRSGNHRLIRL